MTQSCWKYRCPVCGEFIPKSSVTFMTNNHEYETVCNGDNYIADKNWHILYGCAKSVTKGDRCHNYLRSLSDSLDRNSEV